MSKKDDKLQDELVEKYKQETIKIYKALLVTLTPYLALSKIKKLNRVLGKEFKSIGMQQASIVDYLLTIACSSKIKDKRLIKKIIKENWSGERFSDRIYKEKKLLEKTLKKELRNSLINGDPTEDIIKRVSKRLDISVNNAKRLIDTEISNVLAKAELARGQNKGHKYYKIIVTVDDRTSPICKDIHDRNETYLIGSPVIYGVNMVPAHPYCRSRIKTF